MPIGTHVLAVFLLTTTVAMVTPGPDMLFVLGCGMRGGPRAGLLATAGVATSEAVHMVVAATGLAALFIAVPVAFTVVRVAGAGYLIYLGVRTIRRRADGDLSADSDRPADGDRAADGAGVPGHRAYRRHLHRPRRAAGRRALSRRALSRRALSRRAPSRRAPSRRALSRRALSRRAPSRPGPCRPVGPMPSRCGPRRARVLNGASPPIRDATGTGMRL